MISRRQWAEHVVDTKPWRFQGWDHDDIGQWQSTYRTMEGEEHRQAWEPIQSRFDGEHYRKVLIARLEVGL